MSDLVLRLAYRIGYLKGLGFPWYRKDIALHEEAIREIERLLALPKHDERSDIFGPSPEHAA